LLNAVFLSGMSLNKLIFVFQFRMMRKLTLSLLFAASLIILAHAVFPHHHHGMAVCVIPEHCHHCSADCSHPENEPQHDHGNDSQSCSLKQAMLMHSASRYQFTVANAAKTHPDVQNLTVVSGTDAVYFQTAQGRRIQLKTFLSPYLLSWLPGAQGLRAPPVS
jgi:hypothetical protein